MRGKAFLTLLRERPMTSSQLGVAMKRSRSSASAGIHKLKVAGLVEVGDLTARQVGQGGGLANVWRVTARGLALLEEENAPRRDVVDADLEPGEFVGPPEPLTPAPDVYAVIASQPALATVWMHREAA